MNCDRFLKRIARPAILALLCVAGGCRAATDAAPPATAEMFGPATWAALQKNLPRPAAVVFTTTDCTNCPAVFKTLSAATAGKPGIPLVAVIMDADAADALAHSHYFRGITRLFVFDGQENALRYTVDPRWPGMTPYSALLSADGKKRMVLGMPSDAQLAAWLKP